MAQQFEELSAQHIEFIRQQHIFFVGTAGSEGFVNVSPKGMESLRVTGSREVIWLNLTGSGNESAAHVLESPRMTIMFCSFDRQPLILRVYGPATAVHPRHPEWDCLYRQFPETPGARQIFRQRIEMVQTSCGYGVPHYSYGGERITLRKWAEAKGVQGINDYWAQKNRQSLDGKPTAILEDL